jgi:hypothetical protein
MKEFSFEVGYCVLPLLGLYDGGNQPLRLDFTPKWRPVISNIHRVLALSEVRDERGRWRRQVELACLQAEAPQQPVSPTLRHCSRHQINDAT